MPRPGPVAMAASAWRVCMRYVYRAGVPGTSQTAFPGESGRAEGREGLGALRFHLSEPEAHVHLAVHRPCGGEVLPGRVALAPMLLELSQTEVAVSFEGAHAELHRQGQRPEIVVFGRVEVGRIAACVDLAQHPQCACLEPPLAPPL